MWNVISSIVNVNQINHLVVPLVNVALSVMRKGNLRELSHRTGYLGKSSFMIRHRVYSELFVGGMNQYLSEQLITNVPSARNQSPKSCRK